MRGFTAKYGVDHLAWHEAPDSREGAFARERTMMSWRRAWTIEPIERSNPGWRDLFQQVV